MKKIFKRRLAAAAVFAAAGLVLRFGARLLPGFSDSYADVMNAFWVGTLGRLSSLAPFSLVEFLIYGLILYAAANLVVLPFSRGAREHFPAFVGTALLLAGLIFFLFEANEDIYFYRTPFSTAAGYGSGSYTTEELAVTAKKLAGEVNRWSKLVERDDAGGMVCGAGVRERTAAAMEELGKTYPMLAGWYPAAKPVTVSYLMSITDLAGIYSAYTIEANYNRDMTPYNDPFTMSHELSHLKGVLMENEANFVAYLNCMNAKDADIRYSGAMLGWIYCGNELYKRNPDLWREIALTLPAEANYDLDTNTAFWQSWKGQVSEAAESFNDSYLKARGQTDGTESYNRVVDLIVSYERGR